MLVGKEFPDIRQNEREIKFIRMGDTVRTAGQPKWEPTMLLLLLSLDSIVVQLLTCVQLFVTPWTTACQVSLSLTVSWILLKLVFIELVMLSNHLILCCLLLPFPASGSFPMSQQPFTSGGQSFGASASFLSMNIQGWFPLGLTDLISLQSKGLSGVFSSQKH